MICSFMHPARAKGLKSGVDLNPNIAFEILTVSFVKLCDDMVPRLLIAEYDTAKDVGKHDISRR